ncbi:MAG TPA: YggS family pyridoxal phosphate-dependent enzyme [Methylomusa anaerophila]|uniref:Pyridoxal phosphate homeostasis protein n=1 Tax=Methylomusa anaerophila TaxID=1930071 RepID=A0A348APK6_9FIRM|nr:YggS family pyridoxal phosphate-dependent enzyme [Methylomusa anaerophila]BBB93004.1 hypothetical protein MAMMFC1_03713 [Methylomusa anaerophila]HML87163.1 YggS family pyridoxal phosphate-dependent enzyme [Methylomusa anaerophila]
MSVKQNIIEITNKINESLNRRTAANITDSVKIIAVTKNQTVTAMLEAIDAGITAVGENRIQEALTKYPEITGTANCKVEWHLIGHLQTNKARLAVQYFDMIHSVDSERLVTDIDRAAAKLSKRQDILIQVNVAGEDTKYGIPPKIRDLLALVRAVSELENVRLCGLMTVAPYCDDPEAVRPFFRELYYLYNEIVSLNIARVEMKWLSMGMTNDYCVAIEEGANIVRIGTGIFGTRYY